MASDVSSVRIVRLNALMRQLIMFPRLPRKELMQRLEITSARMLQRDIQYLREFYDADITYDFKKQCYKCESPGSFFLQLKLDQDEITALVAGIDMARHFLPHLSKSCDSVWKKIEELLKPDIVAEGKSLGHSARVVLPVAKMDASIFKSLIKHAHDHKAIEILYKSPYNDKPPQRHTLSPWEFYFQEHAWYMLAWNHFFKKEGVWRISRIKEVRESKDAYTPCPPDFDFESIISSAWFSWSKDLKYEVELKIKPPLAASISEIMWHPTQTIEQQPDGSVILRARVSEIEPVEWWAKERRDVEILDVKNEGEDNYVAGN